MVAVMGSEVVSIFVDLPVACDRINSTIVHNHGNLEANHTGAALYQLVQVIRDIGVMRSPLKEELDLLEEAGLTELILARTMRGGIPGGAERTN